MNIEELQKVKAWLDAGAPERVFNMNILVDPEDQTNFNWCGTACCIAGYVYTQVTPRTRYIYDVERVASRVLDLTGPQAGALFYMEDMGTNVAYRGSWERVTTEQASRAVQNMIDFGDPRWPEILGEDYFREK